MAIIIKSGSSASEANVSAAGSLQVLPSAQYNTTPPTPANGTEVAPQADATGSHLVSTEGRKATYRTAAAGALITVTGDAVMLTASASKTVKVTRISIQGTQTTGALCGFTIVKRSTVDTAGTPAILTPTPLDSNDGAATAVAKSFSGGTAPTAGTTVGTLDTNNAFIPNGSGIIAAQTVSIPLATLVFEFGTKPGTKELVLKAGSTEAVCVQFGTAMTGNFMLIVIEHTEE